MSDELRVRIDETGHEIKIELTPASAEIKVAMLAERGPVGPPGPGTLFGDPAPTLSADLDLNGNAIVGQLETANLIVDGGLLG